MKNLLKILLSVKGDKASRDIKLPRKDEKI